MLARCRGVTGDDARKVLGKHHDRDVALGHWVAGIRELFEEVGILICEPESENPLDFGDEGIKQRLEAKRKAIVRGELEFGEFLESERLHCDLSRIHYFFHRITPDIYPMRFDTRFYMALLPADQTPMKKSEEVVNSVWLRPDAALSRVYHADFPILPPTTTVLDDLAQIGSWQKLRARFDLR
jgi:8-oxo-dGTP pyrophosphatase MutT (NUDIX family)